MQLSLDLDAPTSDVGEVLPGLFVGGSTAARHPPSSVRRIVNCTQTEGCHHADRGVRYFQVVVDDNENAKIGKFFEQANGFIAEGLAAGEPVLVHCKEGISRSTTVVVAYLMAKRGLSLSDALAQTCAARPVAKPNRGFLEQLHRYEDSIRSGDREISIATGPRVASCAK
jgi:protein-tyrosine phosphatase